MLQMTLIVLKFFDPWCCFKGRVRMVFQILIFPQSILRYFPISQLTLNFTGIFTRQIQRSPNLRERAVVTFDFILSLFIFLLLFCCSNLYLFALYFFYSTVLIPSILFYKCFLALRLICLQRTRQLPQHLL